MIEFEGILEFGGLYRDGEAVMRPLRPWLVDQAAVSPYDGLPDGDIPCFSDRPDWTHWHLGDTPEVIDARLKWIVIRTETSRLLISDRVLMVYVSWQDLLNVGYISGRQIEIDGISYTCRLLDGGDDFAINEDGYGGAASAANEWDQLVCNEANIEGLPTPTNADVARSIDDVVRAGRHNRLWNWVGVNSWVSRPFVHRDTARCCRGFSSAKFFYLNTFDHRHEDIGWRPVLEQKFD